MADNEQKYGDIINLPHHVSRKRPQMSMEDRAAQFSPFAALTGHDAAIRETARLTEAEAILDETALAVLDMKLRMLQENLKSFPAVTVTYFERVTEISGGAYITTSGALKIIDFDRRKIDFQDGSSILIDAVTELDSDIFPVF